MSIYIYFFFFQRVKDDTEERLKLLQEVEELKKEERKLKEQIVKFSGVDPEAIAQMSQKAMVIIALI